MKLIYKATVGVSAAALLAAGVAAASPLYGLFPQSGDAHPSCDQLPTEAEATAGLARNQDLADEIKALGDGIAVVVGKPCPAGQDRALISVTYSSKSDREAISGLLGRRDGFGVPVYLEKRW
ncbi:hypothetical protein E1258_00755 [Micromonospora sp. KC207]|uniref:hypothetical protein n=1 Tax=Micromonospora sp. KC207 TaxID=2530377 RepID=UPI00104DFB13|nr:hypothetical protein [Micromonospora sp. KC207]TDC67073.1 hypothetical protein E1258_00755 [Micromonospora sp. KC207]